MRLCANHGDVSPTDIAVKLFVTILINRFVAVWDARPHPT